MATLMQDLRYGIRMLLKSPGFTAVAVLTLAFGIGANTAIFSVLDAVLLRPLPYRNPDRLVILWTADPRRNIHEEGTSYPTFEDWRKQSQAFEDMAICSRGNPVTLTNGSEPERVHAELVSANLFSLSVLFGLVPAWKVSRSDPNESLKEGGRGGLAGIRSRRTRELLVIAELALAVVLLSAAGLLVRSFLAVRAVDPGFRPERVLTIKLLAPQLKAAAPRDAFYREVIERIGGLPGVQAVGAISDFFIARHPDLTITVEGASPLAAAGRAKEQLIRDGVSPGFFQAAGVPLRKGRHLTDQDRQGVAIINETMARRFWPGEDSIGKRFKFGDAQGPGRWVSVVGVVGDMRRQSLEKQAASEIFEPAWWPRMDLLVRTASDPLKVASAIRSQIHSIDKTVPLLEVSTLEDQLQEFASERRFQTLLLALFSAIALALAAIGTYGLMQYSVAQRTREMGIRIALGARRSDILAMVGRQGLTLALIGVGLGSLGAMWVTPILRSLLYGVSPTDMVSLASAPLVLIAMTLLACYFPARRAIRVDPMVALRHE